MSQAASHGWPEPPHLAGRPIDTALLLSRDYRLQIDSRITSSPSALTIIPSIIFISFSITIEALVDVLCDRVGITRATGDLLPNIQAGASTSGADWPQAPDLRGRLLDTALLLARDHTQQLRYHIEGHPDEPLRVGVAVNVYFPYSRNMDLLIKALCQYGQVPLNPSSLMPKLGDASNQLWEPQPDPGHAGRVFAKSIATASSPPVSWKAEVPSEPQFLQRCTEITASAPQDPPHTISSTHRTKSKHMKKVTNFTKSLTPTKPAESTKPSNRHHHRVVIDQLNYNVKASSDDPDIVDDDEDENNDFTDTDIMDKDSTGSHSVASNESARNDYYNETLSNSTPTGPSRPTRRLTITLRDRQARSKLESLKRSQILKHIQKSIQEQGIHVKVTKCEKHAGRRANFWVRAQSRKGAGILRKEWDVGVVGVFGKGAYMRDSDGFVGMV
ncbi:MAG: hypothetical protein Q9204_004972 [Flavoplaca sp. TL-2023a]